MESEEALLASDAALPSPVPMRHATDRLRDSELANAVSTTEIMIADFYKKGHLTLRLGQLLLDNLRHPRFDPKDLRSETIVHLLRRFERPFKETAMHTYNLWQEVGPTQIRFRPCIGFGITPGQACPFNL